MDGLWILESNKKKGCSRENTATFNCRIKDVGESLTLSALRRPCKMPALQKRGVLAVLKVSVVHGNNSILHLLKLRKRDYSLNLGLRGRVWRGSPAVQGAGGGTVSEGDATLLGTFDPVLVQKGRSSSCKGVGKSTPSSEAQALCRKRRVEKGDNLLFT